jgi:hypothetical protein
MYMSFVEKYSPQRKEHHREHLARQSEHLSVVRDYQLQCMKRASDPELRENYRDIANLLEQTIGQYEALLAKLQSE